MTTFETFETDAHGWSPLPRGLLALIDRAIAVEVGE